MRHPSRNSKLVPRRTGAAAVEFAIVAPIFFLLVVASLEFGRLNIIRHTADQAAYEAARHAMVPGATAAEATAKATSMLKIIGARDAKIKVVGPTDDTVTVTIDIPMLTNGWITPKFTKATTIHATSTLKTERPID
ncbi:TadE family protein [Lacipirellula sp.]|uniref:TadE family protein n=1 Tax=Lacipirellula sp. TaxID=2691419 RepID=UPI003D0B5C40